MARRQEAKESVHRQARRRAVRRALLWTGAIAFLVLGAWGIAYVAQHASPPGPEGVLAVPVTADEHVKGSPDAPVTLVEYSDFQCPACASFAPLVDELLEVAEGQVRVVYRHFPLRQSHANAQVAAQAAEAAALQGAFWEMHDALFAGQEEWSVQPARDALDTFARYAGQLGLDVERFRDDVESGTVRDAVDADLGSGTQSRVNATPSFFVNGQLISGFRTPDEFRQAVLGSIHADQ